MNFSSCSIPDVFVIEPRIAEDHRGPFIKTYHLKTFELNGIKEKFQESYYSVSREGVIRGMHFQLPPADHVKLVYVTSGGIIDVVLDIRKGSPTYGKFVSFEINDDNRKVVYIPRGCAHGFCALLNNTVVTYLQSTMYSSEHDAGIRFDSFGMKWPVIDPIISDRDSQFPMFKNFVSPFFYQGSI